MLPGGKPLGFALFQSNSHLTISHGLLMRKKFIAGNWKMHLNRADSVALAQAVASKAIGYKQVDVAVCPTFTNLDAVRGALAGTSIALGAQNMSAAPQGAFTGEISAAMLL